MKLAASQTQDLQKKWTDDYVNGRWSNLLQIEGSELAESFRNRALIMQDGQWIVKSIKSQDPWILINTDICWAHTYFIQEKFNSALYHANRAYLRAKKILPELIGDAGFYRALCLNEIGEKYEALSLYAQLRKIKNLTDYRKNLLVTNEAWLLWDMGLTEPLREIVGQIPQPFGSRIQMMLDFLHGSDETLKKYLSKLSLYLNFPQNEKENLFLIVTEAIYVYGSPHDLHSFQTSLFFEDVAHSTKSDLIKFILEGPESQIQLSGRDQIDGLFIKSLSLMRTDNQKARAIYFDLLQNLKKNHKCNSTFIPTEQACQKPVNNWEKSLVAKLFKTQTSIVIDLKVGSKSLIFKDKEVEFSKSPTSWRLIIAFESRHHLKKEEIHEILTQNRYRSDLHDTRIFKLVQRINLKIKKQFGFEICKFNGANELEMNCELRRKAG